MSPLTRAALMAAVALVALAGCQATDGGRAAGGNETTTPGAKSTAVPQETAPEAQWQCLVVGEGGDLLLVGEGGGTPLALGEGEGPGPHDGFAAAVTVDGSRAAFNNHGGGVTLLEVATGRAVTATPGTLVDDGRTPSLVWSPQGDALACVRGGDLYLVSLDGTARRMTTSADVTDACWSPDGKTLAYGRRDKMDKDLGLWSQAACGSKPVRLVPSTGDVFAASWPQWSPDGKWVVFVQAWEGGGLGFVSADGKTKRVGIDMAWFPLLWLGDSSAVVYDGTNPEGPVRGLCVCAPGGKPKVLLKGLIAGYDMLGEGRIVAVRQPEDAGEEGAPASELTVLLADARRPEAAPEEVGKVKGEGPVRVLWRPDGEGYAVVSELWSGGESGESKPQMHLGTPDGPLAPAGAGVRDVIGWVRAPAR